MLNCSSFIPKKKRNSKEYPKPLKCFLWHQKMSFFSTKMCVQALWKNEFWRRGLRYWPFLKEVRMMTAVRERWKSRKAWEAVGRGGGKERVVQVQDARWPELPPDRFPPHKGSCPIWVTSACTIPPHHLLPDLPSTPILADRGALYNVGCYVTFSLPSSPHAGLCHLRVFGITRLEQPLHGTWSEEL